MNGHYGQARYRHSPYGYASYEDLEEMVELDTAPPVYRTPNASNNSFDFQFNDVPAPVMPSPRPPVMPFRPGHMARDEYAPPGSPWLQPTPRSSAGPDSFTNTLYGSRSASPTLVSFNFSVSDLSGF